MRGMGCAWGRSTSVSVLLIVAAMVQVRVGLSLLLIPDRLVGLVVKASASRVEDPGFESRLRPGFFRGRVIPVT